MTTEMAPEPDAIWSDTLDSGSWAVEVVGADDPYRGTLRVRDANGVVVHEEPVAVAYGALYGPDVDDVDAWRYKAIEVVDDPGKRRAP